MLLVGAVDSGKTTLLASLHESFQRNSFANYLAAGSDTLIGFEERCFDSRAASDAPEPKTLRTTFEEGVLFYHLKVRHESLKASFRHLLIADMSGEYYDRGMDSAQEMKELEIITRADHFVHLVDGGALASKDSRNHARANALLLMRRCFEQNMLKPMVRVDVLLTKWDLVLSRLSESGATALLKEYRQLFVKAWGPHVGRLNLVPIAARPHYKSTLPVAYGLEELLQRWLEEPALQLQPVKRRIPVPRLKRVFDTFALTEVPDMFEVDSGT